VMTILCLCAEGITKCNINKGSIPFGLITPVRAGRIHWQARYGLAVATHAHAQKQ